MTCVTEEARRKQMSSAVSQRRPALNRVDLLCQRGGPPYTEEVSVSQGKPSVSQRRPSVSQDALNRGGNINRLGPHWFESPVLFSICFILFYKCEFGPISKNSGLNPGSFRFLAGVRFGPVDTGRPLRPNCPSRNRSLDPPLTVPSDLTTSPVRRAWLRTWIMRNS